MLPGIATHLWIAALVAIAAWAAACGSGSSKHASTAGTTTTGGASQTTTAPYQPKIDPASFSTNIRNKYFPLKPGTTFILDGVRDGQPMHTEMIVTNETKVIMGVTCVVIRDTVTSNGALVEKTTDWYAQEAGGDVWYFGEATAEYANGNVSNTQGSWEAGVDGAQPGIVMKANPKVGDSYRQEYRPGQAEDMAKVVRIDPSRQVPAGTYHEVVVTEDTDPLSPDKIDEKRYAPSAGMIYTKRIRTGHSEESSLTSVHGG
jgi:hypothetical protein